MTVADRYAAFWIPGPDQLDMDVGLRLGYQWLATAPYVGTPVVVLHAKKMLGNRPALAEANRYHVVSPRSRSLPAGEVGPVLAIWPNADAIEFAQQLAMDTALCVIPYRHAIAWWIARTNATNLADPRAEAVGPPALNDVVVAVLESVLRCGGHNGFLGGGEKEMAVGELRALVSAGHRPGPADVEAFARASCETDVDGARRLRSFYESILDGRRLHDYRGRSI